MPRGWFSGPGIGVLNGIFLRLDCTNDPLTAGLEINAATAAEAVLTLLTTDDDPTNPYLDLTNSGTPMPYIMRKDGTRLLHTYGTQNIFAGPNAGNFTLTGIQNVALGEDCLSSLTSGSYNVAVGYLAVSALTTGLRNVALGAFALFNCLTGTHNFALGFQALLNNTSNSNTALGTQALFNNTTGGQNFGLGTYALFNNITGSANVAIGYAVLLNSILSNNVAIGGSAGSNCTGDRNVLIGVSAGYNQQTGRGSVLIGYLAGYGTALHNKAGCVIIGNQAGQNENTSNKLYIANSNTATPLIYGEFDTWRLAFGNQYAVDKYGQLTHASGQFAAVGDAQDSRFVVRRYVEHTDAAWHVLYPDGGTTPERLTIAAETGWTIHVIIIGITAAAAQQWGYEIIGLLERDGAGNTTLAGQTLRVIFESDVNYDAQLAADNANEALEVQVTRGAGGADFDVRWTASVRFAEVTFPA